MHCWPGNTRPERVILSHGLSALVDHDHPAARGGPCAVREFLDDPSDFLVSVVIPARNEAPNLPHVLAALPAGLHEVIVVDGHSTDDTIGAARRARPDVKIVQQ